MAASDEEESLGSLESFLECAVEERSPEWRGEGGSGARVWVGEGKVDGAAEVAMLGEEAERREKERRRGRWMGVRGDRASELVEVAGGLRSRARSGSAAPARERRPQGRQRSLPSRRPSPSVVCLDLSGQEPGVQGGARHRGAGAVNDKEENVRAQAPAQEGHSSRRVGTREAERRAWFDL